MTVRLDLPPEVERRLRAEVEAGRHSSLEEAILEKLSRPDDPDLLTTVDPEVLKRDLEDAWQNREGAVEGDEFFKHLAQKSASFKAQGK